jgi:prolipoprotein diacylglyceryltransferase
MRASALEGIPVHLVFDLLASAAAGLLTWLVYRWRLAGPVDRALGPIGPGYALALVAGAVIGGYGLGTANLLLAGLPGVGRSIVGALLGAVLAVEAYKAWRGIRGSTGLIFATGIAVTVAVGRIGCFLAGIDDYTYGIETTRPWGYDFGDGRPRHPVQLYESAAMLVFLAFALSRLAARSETFLRHGFYLCVGWYGLQRFAWEFLKPYPAVIGPFNLFHGAAAALVVYACCMILGSQNDRS